MRRNHQAAVWRILLAALAVLLSTPHESGDSWAAAITLSPAIQHVVVIFDENISFDHYFGTYPDAANPPGEPRFIAAPGTPRANVLTPVLKTHNPNLVAPFRLDRSQAVTCDNINFYREEQEAYDRGRLDRFVQFTSAPGADCIAGLSMGYYDGNTVTALWNYAQNFALNDNFFETTYGTTVMGHLNLIAGQTHGAVPSDIAGKIVHGSVISNVSPLDDDCSPRGKEPTVRMSGRNIGDLLSARHVTWGWFYGDFAAVGFDSSGKAICDDQYNPHYAPFEYYVSTANPHHLPPGSVAMIGYDGDQANHNYDIDDFWKALDAGNMPQVSFIKSSSPETGHPQTSDPLSEQTFLVNTLNRLQESPEWAHTVVFVTYDDSDGWYDHVMPPVVMPSADPVNDALFGPGLCGRPPAGAYEDRCGYGPRLPVLAISPYARVNYVSHTLTDQSSVTRFIEDRWHLGRLGDRSFDALAGSLDGMLRLSGPPAARVILDPTTGQMIPSARNPPLSTNSASIN
ncbi:MAG TPA: alkaline phosphatase family protein [Candidatus Binataceae bacterium]|nr:alkaline phosphatase family protein [Candidatus Binataceae bacterium]